MDNYEPILASVEGEPVLTAVDNDLKSQKTKMPKFSKDAWLIAITTLVGAILICLTILWVNAGTPSLSNIIKKDGVDNNVAGVLSSANLIDDDEMLGDKKAKVTVVEFSDYQCLYCRKFWSETFPQLKKEYIDTGKIKFVYRDFPLSFHPAAQASAEAAECAGDQGKYWQMHDKMFAEQAKKGTGTISYAVNDIKSWASQIGLNTTSFNSCLDSGKFKLEVEKDAADGAKIGITGTPAFVIGSQTLAGAYPFSEFKRLIDAELAEIDAPPNHIKEYAVNAYWHFASYSRRRAP